MEKLRIALVVGARPNFVKAAALIYATKAFPEIDLHLIHTGQHTGAMLDQYWNELELPIAQNELSYIGLAYQDPAHRLGEMIHVLTDEIRAARPDYVMVVGDTDSTLAGALVGKKLGIRVIHVEAGLRNYDKNMQEEINRILVDIIAMKHYCSHQMHAANLSAEGIETSVTVGNVMIDTLNKMLPHAKNVHKFTGRYAMFTLHRAENIDDRNKFSQMRDMVADVSNELDIEIIWPMHPRYRNWAFTGKASRKIVHAAPMGYLEFISRMSSAEFVITDSGGVQEETTALNVPCFTLRQNTERPETVYEGTNYIMSEPFSEPLYATIQSVINNFPYGTHNPIKFWDGHAAERIFKDLLAR